VNWQTQLYDSNHLEKTDSIINSVSECFILKAYILLRNTFQVYDLCDSMSHLTINSVLCYR